MCVVIPAAVGIAASVASSAIGYIGQRQAASQQQAYNQAVYNQQVQQAQAQAEFQNRQVEAQNEYIRQNRENAAIALQQDRQALVSQSRQEAIATALDVEQKRIEAIRARGAIRASEKSGLQLETLLSDFYRQEAIYQKTSEDNLAFASGQRRLEAERLTAAANSRINEARPLIQAPVQTPFAPAPVAQPSFLGAVIGTASQVGNQLSSRQVYDPYEGRFRFGGQSVAPPRTSSSAPQRSFTTGFSFNKISSVK